MLPFEDVPIGTVLSGYMTEAEAQGEAERVQFEIPKWRGLVLALPRGDERILEYARTHPAWARREGFEGGFRAQAAPPHACPVCGKAVAGGPDEYLGHIRTEHPEEWRRLETEPSYTLSSKVRMPRQLPTFKGYTVDERLGEFRKLEYGKPPEFISFDSPKGKEMLQDWRKESALRTQYRTITRELTEAERKKIAEESFRENPDLDVVYISDYSGVVEKPYYRAGPPVAEAGILRCRFCGAPYAYRENLELHERGCPRRAGYGG